MKHKLIEALLPTREELEEQGYFDEDSDMSGASDKGDANDPSRDR